MKESERILFTDFLASMDKKFIESGWITVSAECLHSALVSDEKLSDVLSRYEWDLIRGSNGVSEIWSNGNGLSVMKVLMSWNHLYYIVLQIMI